MREQSIHVLHVIDTGGPGGAESVFLQLATGLSPRQFSSTPVVGSSGWLSDRVLEFGLTPEILPAKGSFNTRYLLKLGQLARHKKIELVVAHLYGSAVYASLIGTILSIPVISVFHGQTDVSQFERFAAAKRLIVSRGSSRVVFVSQRLEERLRPALRLAGSKCAVIPNGVDTEFFYPRRDHSLRKQLGISKDTLLIGAVGNIRVPKAYDVLLRAARALVDRFRHFHLIIVGDHENSLGDQLGRLCAELGIEQHVSFLGLRHDVSRILNNLDVFVLSSLTEGFSIACIEAMACGIPVIATKSGGPEEILEGGAGILVPTSDSDAIARGIEQVFSSRKLALSLTEKALSRVRQKYSLSRMLARYSELFEEVLQESQ